MKWEGIKNPRVIRSLSSMTGGISRLSQSGLSLLVTLYALHLGANAAEIGVLAGVASIAPIFTSIPLGVMSDRIGARKAMILAFCGFCLTNLLFLFATNFYWLLPIQLISGLFRNATWISSQGYVTARSQGADATRDISTFGMLTNLASMVGPLTVGLMTSKWAYGWSFAVLSVIALLGLGCAVVLPSLTLSQAAGKTARRTRSGRNNVMGAQDFVRAFRLLAQPGMRLVVACTFMRLFVTAVKSTFVPVFLKELSVSNGLIGVLSSLSSLASAAAVPVLPRLSRRFRAEYLLPVALVISSMALGAVPFFTYIPIIAGLLLLQGGSQGLSLPLLMSAVASATVPEERGLGAGLRSTTNRLAQLSSPLVVGILSEWWSLLGAFVVAMSFMVGVGVFAGLYARRAIIAPGGDIQPHSSISG